MIPSFCHGLLSLAKLMKSKVKMTMRRTLLKYEQRYGCTKYINIGGSISIVRLYTVPISKFHLVILL